jgi:protein-tyrosine phosphatase
MSTAVIETTQNRTGRSIVLDRLREVRHLPDSVLRARRRSVARLQVARANPRSVLFVCSGNICRSPFAARLLERLLPHAISGTIKVRSAGFIGLHRPAPLNAQTTASKYGIDLTTHRSLQVSQENIQAADLVVVMAEEQARAIRWRVRPDTVVIVLGDLDPLPSARRTILDPWNGSEEVFEASYDRIDRCVRELVRAITLAD